jgi:hypothetical protein
MALAAALLLLLLLPCQQYASSPYSSYIVSVTYLMLFYVVDPDAL